MTASISPSEDESCQMYSAGWPRLRLMAYHASWSQLLPGKTITPNFMSLAVGEVTLQFSRGSRAATLVTGRISGRVFHRKYYILPQDFQHSLESFRFGGVIRVGHPPHHRFTNA